MQYALQSLRPDTPTKPALAPMLLKLSKGDPAQQAGAVSMPLWVTQWDLNVVTEEQ